MKKKKVAIVSFFKSENYGAILQSYALQSAIEKFGYQVHYLDYKPQRKLSNMRLIKNIIWQLVRFFLGYKKRLLRTQEFIKHNIHVERFLKEENYDIYVSGSDQVWFPGYVNDFFLLNFIKHQRKISYASSFGTAQLDPLLKPYYFNSLSTYTHISTREESGTKIVNTLGLKSTVVLDPTLLFQKEYWKLKSVNPRLSQKYILCYIMSGDIDTANAVFKQANLIAHKMQDNCKVLVIGDKEYRKFIPGYNLICNAGPQEFIGYFENAEYIVTSSFHGTCFSIIFEKNYINILRKNNPVNVRIEELNNKLGLSGIIFYSDSLEHLLDLPPIDYTIVNQILSVYRNHSISFLKTALQ